MRKDITHVFPTDVQTLLAISADGSPQAAEAFAKLRTEVKDGDHGIMATWMKPPLSNSKSSSVKNPSDLSFVIEGILSGHCTGLQFFTVPMEQMPPGGQSYSDLFL